jgi:hypothetical protein
MNLKVAVSLLEEVDVLSLGICLIRQVVLQKKRDCSRGKVSWVTFRPDLSYGNPVSVLASGQNEGQFAARFNGRSPKLTFLYKSTE